MCARKSFQLPRILCLELLGCDLEFEPSWSWALEVFRVLHVQFIGDAPCLQQFTTKNNHISVFALCHHADDMLDSSNKGTCSVSRAFLNLSASHLQVTNPEGLEKAASAARVKPPFCEVFVCGSWLFEYAWIFRVGPLNACQGGQEIPHWHNYKCCIILQRPVILPQREWELGGLDGSVGKEVGCLAPKSISAKHYYQEEIPTLTACEQFTFDFKMILIIFESWRVVWVSFGAITFTSASQRSNLMRSFPTIHICCKVAIASVRGFWRTSSLQGGSDRRDCAPVHGSSVCGWKDLRSLWVVHSRVAFKNSCSGCCL